MSNFLDNFNKKYYPPKEEVFIVRKSQVELLNQLTKGDTIKEIVEQMQLYNVNVANCIAGRACYNLYATNIFQAVYIAKALNLI